MTQRTIFRVAHRRLPFSSIGNSMLRDKSLSIEARGCLAMILTYPADWRFHGEWLCKEAGVGRDKAYALIKELVSKGYCRRKQLRVGSRNGPMEYTFTDMPKHPELPEKPEAEDTPHLTENPKVVPSEQPENQEADKKANIQKFQRISGFELPEKPEALQRQNNKGRFAPENPSVKKEGAYSVTEALRTKGGSPRDTQESFDDYRKRMIAEGKYKVQH